MKLEKRRMDFEIKVNDSQNFFIGVNDLKKLHWTQLKPNHFHLRKGNKNFHVELVSQENSKSYLLLVNGHEMNTLIKDEIDQLVERMGLNSKIKKESLNLIAPMPGLVLDVLVQKGDVVLPGDPLIVLEAMKMENILKSKQEGVVTEIHVEKESKVNKLDLLISIVSA